MIDQDEQAGPELDALITKKIMGGRVRKYSQDISCCWLLIERLDNYRPLLAKTGKIGWRAVFYRTSSPLSAVYRDAPTAPLAVCRAALELMGHE